MNSSVFVVIIFVGFSPFFLEQEKQPAVEDDYYSTTKSTSHENAKICFSQTMKILPYKNKISDSIAHL